jgi:hypothetical protein
VPPADLVASTGERASCGGCNSDEWVCGAPARSLTATVQPRAAYCEPHQSISESTRTRWLFLFSFRPRRSPNLACHKVHICVCARLMPCSFLLRPPGTLESSQRSESHRVSRERSGYKACRCSSGTTISWPFHVAGRTRMEKLQVLGKGGGTLFLEGTDGPTIHEARVSRFPHDCLATLSAPMPDFVVVGDQYAPSDSSRAISNADLAKFYVIRTLLLPMRALVTQAPSPQVLM